MSIRLATRRILTSSKPSQRLSALSAQIAPRSPLTARYPIQTRMMTSQSVPKTMEGVVINKTGGTEVLEYKTDLPVPTPKDGEVLVKNDFVGINYIDTSVTKLLRRPLLY